MSVSYAIPSEYVYSIDYGATDSVLAAPTSLDLTTRNINPDKLLSFRKRQEVIDVPESHGGALVTDGKIGVDSIDFFGEHAGDNPNDTFTYMAQRYASLIGATQQMYLKAGLYDGTTKIYYRRYGSVAYVDAPLVRKVRSLIHRFEMTFEVIDPFWYADTIKADAFTITGGAGSKGTTDAGVGRSPRLIITFTKTSGTAANLTVQNNAAHSLTITDTLPTTGDSWTIDMYAGTVKKTVSGVTTLIPEKVTGRFFEMRNGSDTITVSGGTGNFSATLLWLERVM